MASQSWIENDAPLWYAAPRGTIAQQLLQQARPDRHEHSQNLPPNPNFNLAQYPDVPLRQDLLELFQDSPLASSMQHPLLVRAVDAHGWFILNDWSLIPMLDCYGRFSDGNGRFLGSLIEAGGPFAACIPPPVFEFSSLDLGSPSDICDSSLERQSFLTNPFSPRLPTAVLATPASTKASTSGAETVIAYSTSEFVYSGANCHVSPVADRNFDVGVKAYSLPFNSDSEAVAVIGVEATSYLQQMIDEPPSHEPLLAALGGDPIGLKQHIETELNRWKDNKMRPVFVFDGLNVVGRDEVILEGAKAALGKTSEAWGLYGDNAPAEAVSAFGQAGAIRTSDLYRILQEVLNERELDYIVAPYNSGPQLAYLLDAVDEKGNGYIDGVMGSKELLLYNIEPLIFPMTPTNWENKTFTGVSKEDFYETLNIDSSKSPEFLEDALLMAGTSFLPPFPALLDAELYRHPPTLQNVLNLLRAQEKSVDKASRFFEADLKLRDPRWYDKYMKAKMSLRHPVTITLDGVIATKSWDKLTGDNNEYLGLQLPPELHYYLSTAVVGPRVLNCFVSLNAVVFPTLDGVVSDEYKRLVTRALVPVKETTAALIASRLHRGLQHNDIVMRFWFDVDAKQTLVHRNLHSQVNQRADTWGVKDAALNSHKSVGGGPGTLSFALLSLQIKDFPQSTIAAGRITGLKSKSEVISNALWRLLHLRGYINDQHELNAWGQALAKTMKVLGPTINKYGDVHHLEEAAFLAFELLRFDNLNSRNRHTELIGGPLRGSDEDKANCILIGRAACLLKLRHLNIGYTGPLSKNFLSFHSIIKAVREIDRDLLEAVTASMFLSNQASRERSDKPYYQDLGRSLQFSKDIDTALGIAVKTYLDDFLKLEWSAEEREAKKAEYVQKYLPHSLNFKEDLDVAFKFFDAVYEGVQTLGDEISNTDKEAWKAAKAYLEKRR